jgi:hypothetical protein
MRRTPFRFPTRTRPKPFRICSCWKVYCRRARQGGVSAQVFRVQPPGSLPVRRDMRLKASSAAGDRQRLTGF